MPSDSRHIGLLNRSRSEARLLSDPGDQLRTFLTSEKSQVPPRQRSSPEGPRPPAGLGGAAAP